MEKQLGCIGFGDELLGAIKCGDGAETAVILREMFYLCGWETAQQVAFLTNFRWITTDKDLKWWTAVPN